MEIKITGLDELKKKLGDTGKRLPLALARAMKDTAAQARSEVRRDMARAFDRPTPWALGTIRWGNEGKFTVVIGFTSNNSNNPSSWKEPDFIRPQVEGGSRPIKRVERILRNAGVLPQGMSVVPAKAAWTNQYGNISSQEFEQILRSVKGYGERSFLLSRSGKLRTKKQNRYFVMKRGGGPAGVFEVLGKGNSRAVLWFVKKPSYKTKLSFYNVVYQVFLANFNKNFNARLKEYSGYSL